MVLSGQKPPVFSQSWMIYGLEPRMVCYSSGMPLFRTWNFVATWHLLIFLWHILVYSAQVGWNRQSCFHFQKTPEPDSRMKILIYFCNPYDMIVIRCFSKSYPVWIFMVTLSPLIRFHLISVYSNCMYINLTFPSHFFGDLMCLMIAHQLWWYAEVCWI